jgi:tetratricopeptide (TPR) repeat protein
MQTATLSLLDQAELLKLALNAGATGDPGTAIAYLKEAVSRPDANAITHYILGAEYAQIGMFDRAADAMEAALALDPALAIARLQLALIRLGAGAPLQADDVLAPLQDLAAADPLRLFGRGLSHLIHDQLEDARACLAEGIACNAANPALNGDMQKIVDEIARRASGAEPAAAQEPAAGRDEETAHQLMLSAYTGNSSK